MAVGTEQMRSQQLSSFYLLFSLLHDVADDDDDDGDDDYDDNKHDDKDWKRKQRKGVDTQSNVHGGVMLKNQQHHELKPHVDL